MRALNSFKSKAWLLALVMAVLGLQSVVAAEFPTSPISNGSNKWRIGYYEGGSYANYYEYLRAVTSGLMKLGWIEQQDIPVHNDQDTRELWNWLSKRINSDYIEFVEDAFYTASWDQTVRERVRGDIIRRINDYDDLDLMLALGTWAGKDLSTDGHDTPTIVISASDPVGSGISVSVADSGKDHVLARVDPFRYERQIRVFHDIIGFRSLGVAYEDTPDGRSHAAMDVVRKVAEERGFEIVECHTRSDIADQTLAGESVVGCFQELATRADAIYVTLQGGVNADTLPKLVGIANEHRIPTFSQAGSNEVRSGLLLSISKPSYRPVGLFLAASVAKVFNGARPRQLDQLFAESPNIAINLKTAELIGLYLYADVLAAADEIFRDIAATQ